MKIKKNVYLLLVLVATTYVSFAQDVRTEQRLDSVIISSTRIDIPFKENSRTIQVITADQIQQSAATNVSELLQQVAGIDIRRRGAAGMQADLYIRGGGFDQTLLLIDGIKVEDPQTGHHTMNMILPLEVIKRIEIIKGPAARIFGQNAFTGAINIVTKTDASKVNAVGFEAGSFGQENFMATFGKDLGKSSFIAHASINTSDGYRYNTDFNNQNYFLKGTLNKNNTPINVIGFFTERKFGANGFYASPAFTDQYEETQSSLVGITSVFKKGDLTLKPRVYWKRNQDMYIFVRQNPGIYRNLHQSNKIGAELNASFISNLGTTGFGIDVAKVYLSSNNLGSRDRFMLTTFLEHKFQFANNKWDITPGIAVNYFSDFDFHAFPGVDIGYQIDDHFKVYANAGYTYRIPTYTDLFYSDPTTIGNENLDPEEAISEELGIKYNKGDFSSSLALFNRDSNNLIDYVKAKEEDRWEATNIQELNSFGLEFNASYKFKFNAYNQSFSLGYTYLNEDLKDLDINFSRYSINSLKHHLTSTFRFQFFNNFKQTIVYKLAERTTGDSYSVVDIMGTLDLNSFELYLIANNIFNTEYTETSLVPMPKGNVLIGAKYRF